MNLAGIFWVAMALLVVVGLPIAMVAGARQHLRAMKASGRNKSGGAAGSRAHMPLGNALQELDRLVSRPSVEFTVEAERPVLKREDKTGGD